MCSDYRKSEQQLSMKLCIPIKTETWKKIIILLCIMVRLVKLGKRFHSLSLLLKTPQFQFPWRWRCDNIFLKPTESVFFLLINVYWNMPLGTELVKLTHSAFTFDNSTSLIDVAWRTCLSASMAGLIAKNVYKVLTKAMRFNWMLPEATDHVIWITICSADIRKPSSQLLLDRVCNCILVYTSIGTALYLNDSTFLYHEVS